MGSSCGGVLCVFVFLGGGGRWIDQFSRPVGQVEGPSIEWVRRSIDRFIINPWLPCLACPPHPTHRTQDVHTLTSSFPTSPVYPITKQLWPSALNAAAAAAEAEVAISVCWWCLGSR